MKKPFLFPQWKLKFYWVIPEGVLNRWINKKPLDVDPIFKEVKKKKVKITDILDEAWMIWVDQYVAVISPNLESIKKGT
jgi:hypothetical protein